MLSAERDRNFRLTDAGGTVLLKASNRAEDPQAVAAQTEALVHVAARDPVLPVPRVLAMRDGGLILRWKGAEGVLLMRLLSYLPGTPLARASRPAAQRQGVSTALGRLTLALRGFAHPGAERPLLWDVSRAEELVGLLDHIKDAPARALVGRFLHTFDQPP